MIQHHKRATRGKEAQDVRYPTELDWSHSARCVDSDFNLTPFNDWNTLTSSQNLVMDVGICKLMPS
jgi:hypothetical protein